MDLRFVQLPGGRDVDRLLVRRIAREVPEQGLPDTAISTCKCLKAKDCRTLERADGELGTATASMARLVKRFRPVLRQAKSPQIGGINQSRIPHSWPEVKEPLRIAVARLNNFECFQLPRERVLVMT